MWSTDITYVMERSAVLGRGFCYLVAVIDWFSRYVLSWEVATSLEGSLCLEALDKALVRGSTRPQVFNSDQGVHFTSLDFTARLLAEEIRISMDGRGRALDNIFVERLWRSVKQEEVYIRESETIKQWETPGFPATPGSERARQLLRLLQPSAVAPVTALSDAGSGLLADVAGVSENGRDSIRFDPYLSAGIYLNFAPKWS
jgi:putative transposase